tara:strand:+ start:47 stop:1069 length:1023 start_codon:yes stop_codon:yes gene_type:complete
VKILIDIGHPAHVHYFKNFIKIMKNKNHKFLIIAKNRNITYKLLDSLNIDYIKRKDYPSSLLGKLISIPFTDLFLIIKSILFKPDIMIGFSGTHISHAGFFLRIPSVVLDDTDHAHLAHLSYKYFASSIITPKCFKKKFGNKHIKKNFFTESFYLHKKYFFPNKNVLNKLDIKKNQEYVILRFISWNASHDKGINSLSNDDKIKIFKYLNKRIKVFISSEYELNSDLKQFELKIHPSYFHDVLYYSKFYIGEGGTTASESAIMGVPSIYTNILKMGYIDEHIRNGLVFQTIKVKKIMRLIDKLLVDDKSKYREVSNKILKEKVNPTDYLIDYIENHSLKR